MFSFFADSTDNQPAITVDFHTVNPDSTDFWGNRILYWGERDPSEFRLIKLDDLNESVSYPLVAANLPNGYYGFPLQNISTDQAIFFLECLFNGFYGCPSPQSTKEKPLWRFPFCPNKWPFDISNFSMESTDSGISVSFYYNHPGLVWQSTIKLSSSCCSSSKPAMLWYPGCDYLITHPVKSPQDLDGILEEKDDFYITIYNPESQETYIATLKDNATNYNFAIACWSVLIWTCHSEQIIIN